MNTQNLRGVVRKVSKRISSRNIPGDIHTPSRNFFYCDFTVVSEDGEFRQMRYECPTENLAEAVRDSIAEGMNVELAVNESGEGTHCYVKKMKIVG